MYDQDVSRVEFNEVDEDTNLSDADLAVIALTDDEMEDLSIACKLRSFIIRLNQQETSGFNSESTGEHDGL